MSTHGYALAARPHFMVSGPVAFPKQHWVLAGAIEILAQLSEELAFLEPAKTSNGERSP
jgi:hypothetical protein